MIGIYCIKNKVNNKVYIGSSNGIERRFKKHKTELNTFKHSNTYLTRAFIKYGRESFDFIILEICTLEKLIEKEIFYINKYNSLEREFGYNLRIPAIHPTMVCSEEYSRILSEAKKGITPSNFKEMQAKRWLKVEVFKDGVSMGVFPGYKTAEKAFGITEGYLYSYFKFPNNKRQKYKEFRFEKR